MGTTQPKSFTSRTFKNFKENRGSSKFQGFIDSCNFYPKQTLNTTSFTAADEVQQKRFCTNVFNHKIEGDR